MQGRVQGTGLNLQKFFGSALDVFRDGVAVFRLPKQCAEDENIESALQEFDAGWESAAYDVGILLTFCRVSTECDPRADVMDVAPSATLFGPATSPVQPLAYIYR